MKKTIIALILSLVLAVGLFAGCGQTTTKDAETTTENTPQVTEAAVDESEAPVEEAVGDHCLIGFAPPTMNNAFWIALVEPIKQEVEKRGDELVIIDPQLDQARMNDQIGDLIVQGIDALLVAPFDSTGIEPALVACKEAGIPVVNFDTPVTNTDLVATIIASDNYNAGVVVAKDMMSKLEEGSKISVMGSPSGAATLQRAQGFYDTIGDYFDVVVELDGKGDTGVTLPLAEDVLQGTPDLAAFYATNDPSAIGCLNALEAHPEVNGVLVYGVDGNPDAKKFIEGGKMTGTAAQSPKTIGSESIKAAYTLIEGGSVEKNIVIDTFIITADNVAEYGTDGWQ